MRLIFTLILFLSTTAFAQSDSSVYLKVGKGKTQKSLMALPYFKYSGQKNNIKNLTAKDDLYKKLFSNLELSSYFTMIDPKANLETENKNDGLKPAPHSQGFDYKNWENLNTDYLVKAGFRVIRGNIELDLYTYYIPSKKMIYGRNYNAKIEHTSLLGNRIASDLVKAITGKESFFNSKLLTISNYGGRKDKSVFTMDIDGSNLKKVSNLNTTHLSPTWSNDGKRIAYTAYAFHTRSRMRNPDLFVYELATKKRWLVSYKKGTNSGAVFSPDDSSLYLTISKNGTPNIYKVNTDGKNFQKITNGPGRALNIEPDISSDGKKIVFSSDKSGQPMIYTMNASGGNTKRLTFGGIYNSQPTWSPKDKWIAFAGQQTKNYDIYIIKPDGKQIKKLTSAFKRNGKPANNESPSFSPDGRKIAFVSDRHGPRQIYTINIDGTGEKRITNDNYDYSEVSWSPSLD